MMTSVLYLHIAGGTAALLSMLIPLVTKKGGATHRRAGWVFVSGMAIVSMTAFLLAGTRWLTDSSTQGREAGAFLFFVAILTATSVSAGVRVLRTKSRTGRHRDPWDLAWPTLLTASSIAAAFYGLSTGHHLFTAFSAIGLFVGGGQLAYWLTAPAHPMHWWFEHMGSMLASCIAATTAFLVVNAGRLGFETFSPLVWLTPTIVGVPTIAIWTRYYRRKFAQTARGVTTKIQVHEGSLPGEPIARAASTSEPSR